MLTAENFQFLQEKKFNLISMDNTKVKFFKTLTSRKLPSFKSFKNFKWYFTTSSREGQLEYCICDQRDIKIVIYVSDPMQQYVYIKYGRRVIDLEFETDKVALDFVKELLPEYKMDHEEHMEFERIRFGIPKNGYPELTFEPKVGQVFIPNGRFKRISFEMAIIYKIVVESEDIGYSLLCFKNEKPCYTFLIVPTVSRQFAYTDLRKYKISNDLDNICEILESNCKNELYQKELQILKNHFNQSKV